MDINRFVDKATKYSSGSAPYDVASDLGYFVHILDMGEEALGYHYHVGSAKVIALSSRLSNEKREFVLAHELGHAMMHTHIKVSMFTSTSLYSSDLVERQANIFAALLLFRHREAVTIDELSQKYEIEPNILKDLLGGRMGQKMFAEC